MKRKNNILRRSLAWFLGFGVLFSSLPLGAVGETSAPVEGSMSGMGDMASMMEQYQQFMGGGSDADMSEMMEQYQALMGGGSGGDMTAMLEQFMGGSIDAETAEMISQYMGVDIGALLGGGEEKEPIEWITVNIKDYADWEEFVRNCRLDTWSKDKEVHLKTDLSLEGNEIVPIFGGIFDGEGHTISDLELNEEGSCKGLFRYVQQGAEVKDLNVTGSVNISGGWEATGGIAGENRGTIARCTFEGTVEGSENVGGIAGVNEMTGQIVGCSVSGEISGEHVTGGITGKNSGSLIRCISTADVNADVETVTPELSGLELKDIAASENFTACTDTGGIAGYSAGFIQHCISRGDIGYPHTGYNVGGIVGRQNGYIVNCTNHGKVQGRKEVGGIVGQMEPFMQPKLEAESLMGLGTAFGDLQGKLDGMLAGLGGGNSDISAHMTNLGDLTADAKGSIDGMLGGILDLGEETIDTVNDLSARISRVTEMAVPMIEDIEGTFDSMEEALLYMKDALAEMAEAGDPAGEVMDEIYDAMDDVSDALSDVETAVAALKKALNNLLRALGTTEETKAAAAQTEIALKALAVTLKDTAAAVGKLAEGFAKLEKDDLPLDSELLAEELTAVKAALEKNSEAAGLLSGEVKTLVQALLAEKEPDTALLKDSWSYTAQAIRAMWDSAGEMHDAFDHIRETLPPLKDIGDELQDSADPFGEVFESIADASAFTADSLGELAKIFDDQAKEPVLELPKLSDQFRKDSETLSVTVDAMLAEMQGLQQAVSQMTGDLIDSVRNLIGSFDDIAASLMKPSGTGEIIVDISEEESGLFGISLGAVKSCTNLGEVSGDTNTGGVAGSMAVEVSIDPDLELKLDSMPMVSMQLQTRAVLDGCTNKGTVSSRKDCTGGVVGKAGLGAVKNCVSVGSVSSSGRYVGGIAGEAETPVRDCWSKGLLSGAGYVGGIAGSASELTGCRTQAQLKKVVACSGAVAGKADKMEDNLFVNDELGGVDGISYAGMAEPVDMDTFLKLAGIPKELRTLTVSFVFEDGSVETVQTEHGRSLSEEEIPDLPGKEGYTGYWDGLAGLADVRHDAVVRAVYVAVNSTAQSDQLSADGRPVLLIQGGFESAEEVRLTASDASPELTEREELLEGWAFTLPGRSGEMTVRYLLPAYDGRGVLRLAVRNGGEWQDAEYTVDGSYAVFTVPTGENELACISGPMVIWPWAAAGGGVILAAAAAVLALKKKKRAKAAA